MYGRQCGLFEAHNTTHDVPITEIEVDPSDMEEQGYTATQLQSAENSRRHLLECMISSDVRTIATDTASPSEAWRALNDHFFPLTDAQINLYEHIFF